MTIADTLKSRITTWLHEEWPHGRVTLSWDGETYIFTPMNGGHVRMWACSYGSGPSFHFIVVPNKHAKKVYKTMLKDGAKVTGTPSNTL